MKNDEITAEEAAKIIDCTPRHVRWYFAAGYLPGRKIGARLLVFPRAAVEKLKDNRPRKTGRPPKQKATGREGDKDAGETG